MNNKDGKKRIAHIGFSSTKTVVENAGKHHIDYLSSIMEQMDSNDKQIVTYEQLHDYRKSKSLPVLPDNDSIQPIESSGSFKLKKKKFPLMAKCQKNLKYIKHNRCIPKPRAHVGTLPKESVTVSKGPKKNFEAQIQPRKIQEYEPPKTLSLDSKTKKQVSNVVNKSIEEQNVKILKDKDPSKAKKIKPSMLCESELELPFEAHVSNVTVSSVRNESSEESDNFESFIKEQQVSSRSIQTSLHNSKKKRKKIQKRKVFKRIKNKDASSESDSDNQERSLSRRSQCFVTNKIIESNTIEGVHDYCDNSLQFDFDNIRDDSSDSCDANMTVCTMNQSLSETLNKNLSDNCLSSSAPNCPILATSNEELHQFKDSVSIEDQITSIEPDSSESKNTFEKVDQIQEYDSDECIILDNPLPEFSIRISSVKSVAMLPTTDEDESVDALDPKIPQTQDNIETKNKINTLECVSQTSLLNHQSSSSNQSVAHTSNITNPNNLVHDDSDDCIILDDETSRDAPNHELSNCTSLKPVENYVSKKCVVEPPVPSLNVFHENESPNLLNCAYKTGVKDSQPKESISSSRFKPEALSNKNVWDVLKAIDFEKVKSLPKESPVQGSVISSNTVVNTLAIGKVKSEILETDEIQRLSLPQEMPYHGYSNSNSTNSISYKTNSDIDLINLSDNEDASHNEIVESSNQSLHFISQTKTLSDATIGSTSSDDQKKLQFPNRPPNFETNSGDVSSSGVLDIIDSDLNFLNKSYVPNAFSRSMFPLKQEDSRANLCVVKKETQSTSDELDISSASSLQTLDNAFESDVHKLLDLYKMEYQQYQEIQNTGRNLSDGLNLLLSKQINKLMHIKSSIKNIVKHDPCFLKVSNVKPDLEPIKCDAMVKEERECEKNVSTTELAENVHLSDGENPELSMYNESVLQGIQNSLPPESNLRAEKVKEQLRNVKCAQCGRTASAACQGCFKVFYCSTECGMSDWEKGHNVFCET